MAYIALDLGATNTRIALGSAADDEFSYVDKLGSDPLYTETAEAFVDAVEDVVVDAVATADYSEHDIDAIGVAAPGPIDRNQGTFNPFFFEPVAVDLSPLNRFGAVYMHNDVKVATIGEYVYGGHDTSDIVYVTMSSGIGGGAILNDELVEGRNGNAAEVGHITVDYQSDVECGCGGTGHWHALSGGEGLPKMAAAEFGYAVDDAAEIFEQFQNGDPTAADVVERFREYNARAVEEITNLYNPELIVIGGAVARHNPDTVIDDVADRIDPINQTPEITRSTLGDDAGLYGAKAMCTDAFPQPPL